MNAEMDEIRQRLDAIIDSNFSQAAPIAELNTEINDREAYLYANKEALLKIASACLSLASEELGPDGAHIHLDINKVRFKANLPLTLELRDDWGA